MSQTPFKSLESWFSLSRFHVVQALLEEFQVDMVDADLCGRSVGVLPHGALDPFQLLFHVGNSAWCVQVVLELRL